MHFPELYLGTHFTSMTKKLAGLQSEEENNDFQKYQKCLRQV